MRAVSERIPNVEQFPKIDTPEYYRQFVRSYYYVTKELHTYRHNTYLVLIDVKLITANNKYDQHMDKTSDRTDQNLLWSTFPRNS